MKKAAVGEKHAEYVQSLVALAEVKRQQGNSPDAMLLFREAAEVLQHQDPTFSASMLIVYPISHSKGSAIRALCLIGPVLLLCKGEVLLHQQQHRSALQVQLD